MKEYIKIVLEKFYNKKFTIWLQNFEVKSTAKCSKDKVKYNQQYAIPFGQVLLKLMDID